MVLFGALILAFQLKPVQTWAAKKAAQYLADKLNTKVDIRSLYIQPFSAVVLEDFYVLDKQQDTLVNVPKLTVDLNGFSLFSSIQKKEIDFKLIELDNGSFYLKNEKGNVSNLQFLSDAFKSAPDTAKKAPGKPWDMIFEKTVVNNFHFRYKDQTRDTIYKHQVNFSDIDVKNFGVTVLNMDLKNHLFKGDVQGLTLHEKSGFYVQNFSARATIDSNLILTQNLYIKTPNSNIKNFLRMRFVHFKDFDDFENRIHMEGDFHSSHISSKDISYFTSGLSKVNFELGVDGNIKGLVNHLQATHLTVTAGQATYIKGNFSLRGLPDWDNTFLELKFDQLATNKRDMDYLFSHFTGDAKAKAPSFLARFGNINFTGRFTGLQNDFVTYGTFKTALGRFDPDINLKLKGSVPRYSGKISGYNFDLGKLTGTDSLGRGTFTAVVDGSGDALKNLDVKAKAQIKSITFKNYTYNEVAFDGGFSKQVASGNVKINDKNIKLDLTGSIDLNNELPVYKLTASVDEAHLNTLHLLADTVTFSSKFSANFSGNDLKNFEGKIFLSPARIVNPRNNYVVDTLSLTANGHGSSRTIALESDFMDCSIKGSYDLATLPAYFETIVKKYIPSLKVKIPEPKAQNFEFNLKLKNMDPITALFMPSLKIPDRGMFTGKFNSDEKTATLNGYVKTIKYGSTVFHDLILDESTTEDFMNVNLSLNKIDLTDKLFIKNIDITNFLKHDSLNFNVKLADKDATNQLDLYGLVRFDRDTTARLELLPSDIILEHQDWRLQKNVSIRVIDGKTRVSGFMLSNGQQNVKIDGFISDNPADKLKVTFDKFSMHTLDQLTKAAEVQMSGVMNGDVYVTGITGQPGFDAQLGIDSFKMNTTLVGNVKLVSKLDNNRNEADVKLNILNRGLETLNIGGTYALGKSSNDKLDFDVKMNQTEAIIFQPFVKSLISNLNGTLSTDLKLSGSASKPQLNGDISLNNLGLTVNYLKTAYTVNDKLSVKDNVVLVKDMQLKDAKQGVGTVNGTVDISDLSNPDIEVQLDAKNLMALNTNFKDNHLYFGTAYASGVFKFNGPTDNMNIDIQAKTEAGTVFNLPLNTSSTVSDYDFIRYVSHKDTAQTFTKTKAFNGITLNFLLNIDEKTTVKITTDYGTLEGTGQAKNLQLHINSLGDFDMFGDFEITSGRFDFTAKNFISKNFTVNQGGTIHWNGNPSNAQINLNAIYEVRTDVSNLYNAAGFAPPNNKIVLVQAELIITKSLLQPNIDFDFNFPTDPSIKDDLGTYLADNNNRNMQALSVIVRRNFTPATGNNSLTNQVVGTASTAFSEFAFNKLNNVISQSNFSKNVDLNIRSFNDFSATLKLLRERLILNGSLFANTSNNNLFNTSTTIFNQNANNLTTDFEGSYLIRTDGSLAARYSYRVLNSTTLNTINQIGSQYVNGVGLVYQRDFDNFSEFLHYFLHRRRKTPVLPPVGTQTGGPPAKTPDTSENDDDQ